MKWTLFSSYPPKSQHVTGLLLRTVSFSFLEEKVVVCSCMVTSYRAWPRLCRSACSRASDSSPGNTGPLLFSSAAAAGSSLFPGLRELLCVAGFHSPSDKRSPGIRSDPSERAVPLHQGTAAGEDVHGPGGQSG